MPPPHTWTLLARILRPQGRKGEVLADLYTDFPHRFAERPDVWLAPNGFSDSGQHALEPQPATVIAHWLPVGRNAGRVVLHFAGIESISAAEQLAGREVVVPSDARMPLEHGAAYISDLVGCTVYDDGTLIGVVEDVQFATAADGIRRLEHAAPLLVLQGSDHQELLVPFANEYLRELDTEGRTIRMHLPRGLIDVNDLESK